MDPLTLFSFVPRIGIFVLLGAAAIFTVVLIKFLRRPKNSTPPQTAPPPPVKSPSPLKNKKIILSAVVLALLLTGLVGGVILVRNRQETRSKAAVICGECVTNADCNPNGGTDLKCDPNQCCVPNTVGCYVNKCQGGACIEGVWSPDCSGNQCSGAGDTTSCAPPPCVPNCSGKQCGDDGCGNSCGTCPAGTTCVTAGTDIWQCTPISSPPPDQCGVVGDCPVNANGCAATDCNGMPRECRYPTGSCLSCGGPGVSCANPPSGVQGDDMCCSKVCSNGTCLRSTVAEACGTFGDIECWTHNNCYFKDGQCIPRPSQPPTGGTINCSATSVTNNTTAPINCTATYFTCTQGRSSETECNANPFCSGGEQTKDLGTIQPGSSAPVTSVPSISCGVYQVDIVVSCGSYGCSGATNGCNWPPSCSGGVTPTPSGPTCNQACTGTGQGNCPAGLQCLSGTCQNASCLGDTDCVCGTNNAACNSVIADKVLSTLKNGDTVTFTGYGWVSVTTDTIDLINFIITKDGTEVVNTNVAALRATEKDIANEYFYKANYTYTIGGTGSYAVKVRAHWVQGNIWKD